MSWTPPTIAAFKAQFVRDFPYAPPQDLTNLDYVIDADIQSAINEGQLSINDDSMYGANTTQIFLYLAAHLLTENIRNSMQGLTSQAKFALESSSVGGVAISNAIPESFKSNPIFAGYLTTGYGKKFLNLVYPYTIGGAVGVDCGFSGAN